MAPYSFFFLNLLILISDNCFYKNIDAISINIGTASLYILIEICP
jgi:hypothetical protein